MEISSARSVFVCYQLFSSLSIIIISDWDSRQVPFDARDWWYYWWQSDYISWWIRNTGQASKTLKSNLVSRLRHVRLTVIVWYCVILCDTVWYGHINCFYWVLVRNWDKVLFGVGNLWEELKHLIYDLANIPWRDTQHESSLMRFIM